MERLYGGIDLHSNNGVVAIVDAQGTTRRPRTSVAFAAIAELPILIAALARLDKETKKAA